MNDEMLCETSGHVGVIKFNRPDRMNTITPPMLNALSERLLEADRDPNIRAIVITGVGRAWCAGLDVGAAASGDGIGGDTSNMHGGDFNLRDAPPIVLNKIDTPTIAALNGGARAAPIPRAAAAARELSRKTVAGVHRRRVSGCASAASLGPAVQSIAGVRRWSAKDAP